MQDIRISQILDDLERGLTRDVLSVGYNSELGCIQNKYNLNNKELKYLFNHPKLKGKRAKLPVMFNLIDDTERINNTRVIPDPGVLQARNLADMASIQGGLSEAMGTSTILVAGVREVTESDNVPTVSDETW